MMGPSSYFEGSAHVVNDRRGRSRCDKRANESTRSLRELRTRAHRPRVREKRRTDANHDAGLLSAPAKLREEREPSIAQRRVGGEAFAPEILRALEPLGDHEGRTDRGSRAHI